MNLVPAIEALEEQMSELEKNYRRERADLEEGLKALRKLNTVCERCKGKGKVLRSRVCAEDDRPDPDDIRDWKMAMTRGPVTRWTFILEKK